ncbi:hypothetical protein CANCADRAFT_101173 [Tortispora caseinolytica NRRL Y-17796]|uniref:Ribosomal RNA-processing protein 42 n=1 Tax=Tortispora caseinolytica NRRL Y-17796 TaxID=767744 RepID=A0A1E4TEG2_9ASCO|nr:hypothetical protein CANCADRAFT_101173 [Tortispora caseinolytica NRRL Y-17796]
MLSAPELSYLSSSLRLDEPIRPDGRLPSQCMNVSLQLDVVESGFGSATVSRHADGAEVTAVVKAQCTPNTDGIPQIVVSVIPPPDSDMAQSAEASHGANTLANLLRQALLSSIPFSALRIGPHHAFTLYLDIAINISGDIIFDSLPPLSKLPVHLCSFAAYSALKSAKLPTLDATQSDLSYFTNEDRQAIINNPQIPVFDSDWSNSRPLCSEWSPPLLLLYAICGTNILLDPTSLEQAVCDSGLIAIVSEEGVILHSELVRLGQGTVLLSGSGSDRRRVCRSDQISKILLDSQQHARSFIKALNVSA